MRQLNTFTLNITVAILDFLYQGRHFQRFWVLEEIARAPYFAFLSVLHLRESLGLRGQWHIYLKNHVLCMRMMTIVELIQFFEYVLYIYVAWLSGVLLGYLLGVRSGGD